MRYQRPYKVKESWCRRADKVDFVGKIDNFGGVIPNFRLHIFVRAVLDGDFIPNAKFGIKKPRGFI